MHIQTSTGKFNFDLLREIEKTPGYEAPFSCKPRPSYSMFIFRFHPKDRRAPGRLAKILLNHFFPDQNRYKHRSSPVSITVWSWDQDWEQRPTTTTTRHPSRRRPSPMAATTTTRCPWNRLRNRDWDRRPSWAQHRNNNSHNTADGRSTTMTTTATAIRAASATKENNVDEKSRWQQWAPPTSTWGDRERRDRARAEKFRNTFDRCPISSELHRQRLQQWTNQLDFCFLLVVFSMQTHFLAGPQGTKNFLTWVRTPVQHQFFLSLIVSNFFSIDLVWSLKRGTDSSHDFFLQSNCNHHSFLTLP